uniref:Predicted protein n=1 Tax=Hordeum vulgare subsp. vulgare TaxID=112509 RepID=F2EGQ9_HORVV|nr:predicted protein [Hordeum vulgare subsp. vulgare]
MAARALTAAAGRRVAGRTMTTPLLASCRNGASMSHSSATAGARREEEPYKDVHGPAAAAAMTGAQVEAALNRKNVEVLQGEEEEEEHVATVLPDETVSIPAGDGEEDASWVPDQDTGVFGPAHVDATHGDGGAAHPAPPHLFGGATATAYSTHGSVLDQAVFVREEDMEDVERPAAVDMANANADVNGSIKNF